MDAIRNACAGRADTIANLAQLNDRRGTVAFLRSATEGKIVRAGIGAGPAGGWVGAVSPVASSWEQIYLRRICDGRYVVSNRQTSNYWKAQQTPRTAQPQEGRVDPVRIQANDQVITRFSIFWAGVDPGTDQRVGTTGLVSMAYNGYVKAGCSGFGDVNMCVQASNTGPPGPRGVFELRAWYSCDSGRAGAARWLSPGQVGCALRPSVWVSG